MKDLGNFSGKEREWEELRRLTQQGAGGLRSLSDEELVRYMRLYRRASGDLAALSSLGLDSQAAAELNSVVCRAYGQLYSSPRRPLQEALSRAVWVCADTVRRRSVFVFVAIGLFLFFTFFSIGLLQTVPQTRPLLVPPMMRDAFDHWTSGEHPQRGAGESVQATFFYAGNNPRVAILYNAASVVTCGAAGVWSMWVNGSMMGALALEVTKAGHLPFLLISIFPHGVPELGGIFIAVGAGLLLGWTIISPGRQSRSLALKMAGKDAAVMLGVSLFLIFLAAPIEGFFSFNPRFTDGSKIAFGVFGLTALLSYFLAYGKSGPPRGFTLEELRPPEGNP
jgi:uncharacterized membrane protein SpoIIM required for sporulation